MLQEWVKDPSVATATVVETRSRVNRSYNATDFEWVSKADLTMRHSADIYPSRMPHVLKLLSGSLDSKFHPQYP
eukprot:8197389-Heterocapsa_arctica.AAC.1